MRASVHAVRPTKPFGEAQMETLRETPIQLIQDKEFEEDVGPYYGKYLGTFISARGQVRRRPVRRRLRKVNA